MAKGIEIVIAGVIAGVVAYTTSILGIKGTVLGAVITSILVELLSNFFKEPFEKTSLRRKSVKIIYLLPLVIIGLIELIYLFMDSSFTSYKLFNLLENMANNNLFRIMGLSLMVMGIYPIIQPKDIKRTYGLIVLVMGIILTLRGFIDSDFTFVSVYYVIFTEYDFILSGLVVAGLAFVILNVINEVFRVKDDNLKEYNNIRGGFNKNYKNKPKHKKYKSNYNPKHKNRAGHKRNIKYYGESKPNNVDVAQSTKNNVDTKSTKDSNDLDNPVSEKTQLYYNTPDDLDNLGKE